MYLRFQQGTIAGMFAQPGGYARADMKKDY